MEAAWEFPRLPYLLSRIYFLTLSALVVGWEPITPERYRKYDEKHGIHNRKDNYCVYSSFFLSSFLVVLIDTKMNGFTTNNIFIFLFLVEVVYIFKKVEWK